MKIQAVPDILVKLDTKKKRILYSYLKYFFYSNKHVPQLEKVKKIKGKSKILFVCPFNLY